MFWCGRLCIASQAPTGGVFVQDLTTVTVSNLDEVILVMTKGYKNRAVGSHNVNEHSSRSHLVLSVQVRSCGCDCSTHLLFCYYYHNYTVIDCDLDGIADILCFLHMLACV